MAKRRMISRDIMRSDKFLDLPLTSQTLYVHFILEADDDGFVGNPKAVLRFIGATKGDAEALISSGYIKTFESGIIAITHWKEQNSIRKDRYTPTIYTDEKMLIDGQTLDSPRTVHGQSTDSQWTVHGQSTDSQWTAEDRIGKDRLVEDRLGKDSSGKESVDKKSITEIIEYLNSKLGSSYKSNTVNTVKHINARLNEGFTVNDFKTVIDKKCDEWEDTDMAKYLRPETLFGTKFESYLNAPISKRKYDKDTARIIEIEEELFNVPEWEQEDSWNIKHFREIRKELMELYEKRGETREKDISKYFPYYRTYKWENDYK